MSYETRDEAVSNWVPSDANRLIDRQDFIVYVWKQHLYVLAVFRLGAGTEFEAWHVSMDVTLNLRQLTKLLKETTTNEYRKRTLE